jgi:hypothetical protein
MLWKAHIDQMMPKLNTVCFVIRMIQSIMSQETLRMVYFAYVHSIMSYEIIVWGNLQYSEKIFKIQKRWLESLQIQDLETYVRNCLKINIFFINICNKKHLFSTNYQIHSVHTRSKTNLHPPIANLTKFQKGVYYSGIKIINNLPHNIKELANEIKLFKNALKRFLFINYFYNSEEYFNY